MIANGGFIPTGFRSLTGAPVFVYKASSYTTDSEVAVLHDLIYQNDQLGYLGGVGTAGGGNDQDKNVCGIAMSHAYTLLAAFNMTDGSGVVHRMLMVRNPWGSNYYNWTWNPSDPNWTTALKS